MTRAPKNFQGIMVSSTFTGLEQHRQEVMAAISKLDFKPVVMEHSGAAAVDVITKSLEMVGDCAAYVLLVSHRYGQTPKHVSNPKGLSITELEFNEAVKLKRPRLLFVMAKDHSVTLEQVEDDPAKQIKLKDFKQRAKLASPDDPDSDLTYIYEEFSSADDLAKKAAIAIGKLIRQLQPFPSPQADQTLDPATTELPPIPRPHPPALRAIPSYGASHDFVGRQHELDSLDDWASPNDSRPILLFEAIGGTGKSMLTWHWLNGPGQATSGWAGRFWYSFYEQGATLAEFCWEALSYMTGFPVESFRKLRAPELADRLTAQLNAGRWLLVLDGIERILVGYQRLDAPQLRDEDVDDITDTIADRDPCLCIRPEDDDLLQRLAQVRGSKLLVSSRLTPAKLINVSGMAIPGVHRELLKGLRPPDALAMFKASGVTGPDPAMQDFLHANCDGHPLTVGALAGLVNNYPPDHGNFLRWRDDAGHGGALNLADCNLVQKRNHILDAAIAALASKTRELLQGLAIMRGGADYELLVAINPFLPPEPKKVEEPDNPEVHFKAIWHHFSLIKRRNLLAEYERAMASYSAYSEEKAALQADPVVKSAPDHLNKALWDLERRGLLQFDKSTRRYDLHPVVRGVASGRMRGEEVDASGTRIVDYCQARSPDDWGHAKSLADVELGLQTVSALLRMGRFEQACKVFRGSLSRTLYQNLEANDVNLSLIRGFFPNGLLQKSVLTQPDQEGYMLNEAALAMNYKDTSRSRVLLARSIELSASIDDHINLFMSALNLLMISEIYVRHRILALLLNYSAILDKKYIDFTISCRQCNFQTIVGEYSKAKISLDRLSKYNLEDRRLSFPGILEYYIALNAYSSGTLTEEILIIAEEAARNGNVRAPQRYLAALRGRWLLDQDRLDAAIPPLQSAIAMARNIGEEDHEAEAALALARLRGDDANLQPDPGRWDKFEGTAALYLAWFWKEYGDPDRALAAAIKAFRDAHDPGEPYVYRWIADRARALILELGGTPPVIPPYNPADYPPFPWEAKVEAVIAKLKAEKAAAKAEKDSGPVQKILRRNPSE